MLNVSEEFVLETKIGKQLKKHVTLIFTGGYDCLRLKDISFPRMTVDCRKQTLICGYNKTHAMTGVIPQTRVSALLCSKTTNNISQSRFS
jgi:hypothetical protein